MIDNDTKSIGQEYYERPTTPVAKYYQNLYKPENAEALRYLLEERKFTIETLQKFKIGLNEQGEIAIPIFKDGELIDYKFRGIKQKTFTRVKRSETWVINDGALEGCLDAGYLLVTEGECFTGDAEILTRGGWRRLADYKGGIVAQYNINGTIDFINPIAYVDKEYSGNLILLENHQKFYSLTTENHNIVLEDNNGTLFKRKARDINSTPYHIPRTTMHISGEGIKLTDNEIRLCIAVSADFTMRKEGDIYGAFKKQRKIKRIKSILNGLKIEYSSSVEASGHTNIFIRRKNAPKYLFKEFPHEWIYQSTLAQKKLIIEEMVNWDGNYVPNRNQVEYSSKLYSNATFIQTIAHLSGTTATIINRSNKLGSWYKVSILFNKKYTDTQSLHDNKKVIKYNGRVFCIQVPSGMLLVRQGGCISVSGNCDALAVWQMGLKSVISGTGGVNGKTPWIARIPNELKRIYINCDFDEAGQEYARKLAEKIGLERCYNVILPVKDANDFIKAGYGGKEYREILKTAKRFNIKDIVKISEVLEDLRTKNIERIPTFLNRLNFYTNGGIPRKSMIVLSGDTGVGKSSTLLNFLINHANNGHPVLLISLENDMHFTMQRLLEIKFQKKIQDFTPDFWDNVKDELVDYPFYIDVSMSTYAMYKIERIVDQAKKLWGIEVLGYDHVGFLPNRQHNVAQEMSQMSRDFKMLCMEKDIIAYVISHIRKKPTGQAFISGEDLKDTSSLKQDADLIFLIIPVGTNEFVLSIDKARMSRSKVNIPIIFDREMGIVKDDMERHATSFNEELSETPTSFFAPKLQVEAQSINDYVEGIDIGEY